MYKEINAQNEEINAQNAEVKPAGDTQQTRAFTQEEIDAIIEKRLSRERKKFNSIISGKDPRELELDERESVIKEKEMRITARTLLNQYRISEESLELLNYENEEKLKQSVELLKNIIDNSSRKQIEKILIGGRPPKAAPEEYYSQNDMIRGAFGFKEK